MAYAMATGGGAYRTSDYRTVPIEKIRILPAFAACEPSSWKLDAKKEHRRAYGEYDRPLLIDRDGWLLDGYATFLAMLSNGEREAQVLVQERPWMAAAFWLGDGRYAWYAVPVGFARKLYPGCRALVRADGRFRVLAVKNVETCPSRHCPAAWGMKLPFWKAGGGND